MSPTGLVDDAEREIGEPATWWAAQTAERIVAEVTDRFREGERPAMVTGSEREGCEASILTVLMGLHRKVPSVSRSESATENVNQSVHRGVPVDTVLQTVWACHAMVLDALLAEVEAALPADRLVEEVRHLSRTMNGYITCFASDLIREYEAELALWKGRVPAEQLRLFSALIAGGDADEGAEEVLGLRLADAHLIASVWSRSGSHIADREAAVVVFARTAGRALGAARTLVLPRDDLAEVWWSWEGDPPRDHLDLLRQVARPAWLDVALGVPGRGVGGLRASHQACLHAARVGHASGVDTFWSYEQVRVVALLSADADAARAFTRTVLAGLTSSDAKSVTLRETLRVWLQSGGSRATTAKRLFIAANTVPYRVGRAGALLGRPAGERTVETLLALDLAHYFPDYLV